MTLFSDWLLGLIRGAKQSFGGDMRNKNELISALIFMYHACKATEQLLADAFNRALYTEQSELADYYLRHLSEEEGELVFLVDDLKSVGVDVMLTEPDPAAMAMIGTQYYLIKHVDPVCLLGYMAIQEADPTPVSVVEELEKLHGKELFTFWRLHALKDLEHRIELIQVINAAPETKQPLVLMSTRNALGYLTYFYGRSSF